MAQKNEISAAFFGTTSPTPPVGAGGLRAWPDEQVSVSGRFYRAGIRGEASPMYYSFGLVTDFDEGRPMFVQNPDNPNSGLTISREPILGNNAAKIVGADNYGVWNNRLQLSDLGYLFGIYQDLEFDIYLDAGKVNTGSAAAAFQFKPIFQYPPNWWNDAIPDVSVPGNAFAPVDGTNLVKAKVTVPIKPLGASAKDALGHIVFLISLTGMTAGSDVWFDNVAFSTNFNGDVSKLPEVPDEPGSFIKLPFDFEAGTREGWAAEGTSKASNKQLSVGMAESRALKFPAAFESDKNAWEDGYRLSSSQSLGINPYNLAYWQGIRYILMEVFLEPDSATQGVLQMEVCPIPNGAGFWYQIPGSANIDPVGGGESVTASDGRALLKYTIVKPFDISNYSQSNIRPRNLVLALHGSGCDYVGDIFYDNIGFLTQEEYDALFVPAPKLGLQPYQAPAFSLKVGQRVILGLDTNIDYSDLVFTYSSNYLKIDQQTGMVTAVRSGVAVITITTKVDPSLKLTLICQIG